MKYHWSKLFLCIILLSNYCTLYSQNDSIPPEVEAKVLALVGNAYKFFYSNLDSTVFYLDQAITIAKDIKSTETVFPLEFNRIKCASDFYELEKQKQFLDETASYFLQTKHLIDSAELLLDYQVNIDTYYGNYHYKVGNFNTAKRYYEKIVATLKASSPLSWRQYHYLNSSLLYIGTINKKLGNYDRAKENFIRVIDYDNDCFDLHQKRTNTQILYKHLAETFQFLGDYENAELYYQKTIKQNKTNKKSNSLINSLNAFAKFYIEKKQADSALHYLNQSQAIQSDNSPFIAKTYQLTAEAHALNSNHQQANTLFPKALEKVTALYGQEHYKVAEINNAFGQALLRQQQPEKALAAFNKALNCLSPNYTADPTKAPHISTLYAPKVMLEVMTNKMGLLANSKKTKNLQTAYSYALRTIDLIDSLRLDYDADASRQFLLNKSYPIFEQGIAICHELYTQTQNQQYLEQAFRMAEKSKAVLLLDAIKNASAEEFAGIPNKVLEKGYQLRFKIKRLEDQLEKAKQKKNKPEQQLATRTELFETRQAYNTYIKQLEQTHPQYYQLKYDLATVTVKELQRQLLPNSTTSLIEYFIGDQAIYRFNIGKSTTGFDQIPTTFPLKEWVLQLRKSINGKSNTDAVEYTKTAYQLYEKLLSNTPLSKQLIIIPDGILGYVPFDALITRPIIENNTRAFSEHPYLVRQHNISYSFSATLLKEMMAKESAAVKPFLGFAPSFKTFNPLPVSQQITAELSSKYDGDYWSNQQADKARFIKEAGQYNILHISSHAVANDSLKDACYLVCAQSNSNDDHLLYTRDLYQLDLNASLVVLGACETGSGKLQRGEGILSLARGFSYAGASSLLTTLWSVDEASTAQLLKAFYTQLQQGNTTNDALFQAKTQYLNTVSSEKEAHPRYWAALIPIGDMQAINEKRNSTILLLGLGGLFLLALFSYQFFFKK